jgi:hypothetical protein
MNPTGNTGEIDLTKPLIDVETKTELQRQLKRLDQLEKLLPRVLAAGLQPELTQQEITDLKTRINKMLANLG